MSDRIEIDLKSGFFTDSCHQIRVRAVYDHVLMLISSKVVKMATPAAHKAGFALAKKAGEALCGEFVIMTVNGEKFELPPESALSLGGALLRKADHVDDYQLRKEK